MKSVCFARILGVPRAGTKHSKGTVDPAGRPILISTPPFDETVKTPVEAISQRAALTHGIVPYERHWSLISVYQVTEKALARNPNMHQRAFVFEYTPELERRRILGIDEAVLDPFAQGQNESWYMQKCIIDRTGEATA